MIQPVTKFYDTRFKLEDGQLFNTLAWKEWVEDRDATLITTDEPIVLTGTNYRLAEVYQRLLVMFVPCQGHRLSKGSPNGCASETELDEWLKKNQSLF